MTDAAQALDWHETERANLVAAVRQAADLGLHETTARIAVALWGFFWRTGYHEDWLRTSEIGVRSARVLADDAVLSWLLNSLGQAHCMLGHFLAARRCFTEALAIRRRTGDRIGEGMVLNSLAINLCHENRFEEALEYFEEALAHLEWALAAGSSSGGRAQAAIALNNIGHVLLKLKRHAEALDRLRQALAIQQRLGNLFSVGIAQETLGQVYHDIGQFEDAVEHYREALAAIQGSAPEHPEHADVLLGLGGALDALGRTGEARDAWRAAIPILDRNNDPRAAELRARLTGPGESGTSG
jgi:tetratricopeptide (TPR) repeat protein